MYPFKAILVGEDTKLEPARQELSARGVEVEATFPDTSATLGWLGHAPEARRLFVVHVACTEELEAIRKLRSHCVGQPFLALSPAADTDKNALIRLMRAGVDQAVLLPLEPGEFQAALNSLVWQFGSPEIRAPVIAVTGVAPGCGVSTVAVNLAHEIARRGKDCILVEMQHRLGKLAAQLGVTARFTTRELLAAGDRLDVHMVEQALVPVADHLRLLAAAADEAHPVELGRERFRAVHALFRKVTELVLLRVGYNVAGSYFACLAEADQVVLIAQHTAASLHDLKVMCQALRREHSIRALYPVINRYDGSKHELSLAAIQEALEEPLVLTVAADRALTRPGNRIQIMQQRTFGRTALRDVQAIARLLLHEPEPPKTSGVAAWLKRVFSRD